MAVQVVIRHGGNSSLAGSLAKFGEGVVTIGRRADNVVAFSPDKDPVVSGHHAELRITPTGVTLHDLRSANGTFVGGEAVTLEGRPITTTTVVVLGRGGPTLAVEVSGLPARRKPVALPSAVSIAPAAAEEDADTPAPPADVDAAPPAPTTTRTTADGPGIRPLVFVTAALVACVALAVLLYVRSRPAPPTGKKAVEAASRSV